MNGGVFSMLSVLLLIVIIVWAIKELAEGTGVKDRIVYGKQERERPKREED